jgi:hypothetical protein
VPRRSLKLSDLALIGLFASETDDLRLVVTAFALDVSFLAGSTFVDTVVTLAGTTNDIGPPAGLPCIAATSGLRASLLDARLLLPSSRGAGFAVLLRTIPLLLNA